MLYHIICRNNSSRHQKSEVSRLNYKNSALSDEQLKNTYEKQLHLYADAASRFYGIKIKKKAIINLTTESVIEL